ncbi:hypothetical protein ACH4MU_15560 [Streptomyces albidoflavus]|uniref:Uncharacterized protein n=1 Tax=Streptomyces wadayamensis TaxID=141454 RepID=A0ABR4SAN5_9ACTN|nr:MULTISPECIES: hypothetical protein [Streptomyces]MYQ73966.1 hypothetical protein [Streptomyces sp. SID4934]KDR62723.1 hypothetical protein DC60_08590 [Streptomyces wadayamensis]QXQ25892.1 hypothetical protein STALF2_14795 [Streptomyces albidoflavus]QXQ31821.1 hypothetical protein STALF4_14845 [Streptomyces albidoflavus]SCE34268.1 hypothetical protein GA0115237_111982 [Streptomyces sp. ScaeMP-6W]
MDELSDSTTAVRRLIDASLDDPTINLSVPTMLSLAGREGLRLDTLAELNRGDYHPGVGQAPGTLTYRRGEEVVAVPLSPESELLLSAYFES